MCVFESRGFDEFGRRASTRGWHGVLCKVDSRFLHLYGSCSRICRFADLGIRCYCSWSRWDIVGFEFVFSGDWQGDVCDARLDGEYRPPWYTFGSLEPREEMADARKTEVRIWRSGPTTPPLPGRERARHDQSQRCHAFTFRSESHKCSIGLVLKSVCCLRTSRLVGEFAVSVVFGARDHYDSRSRM